MKSNVQVPIYYFIYYHGNKYAFIEMKFESKFFGVRLKYKGIYYCVINSRYSNMRINETRHALLNSRKLRMKNKRW